METEPYQNNEAPTSQMGTDVLLDSSKTKSNNFQSSKRRRTYAPKWSSVEIHEPMENIPNFLVIQKEDGGYARCSPFAIDKMVCAEIGKVKRIQKLKDSLLVETSNSKQSKCLLKLKSLGGSVIKVTPHKSLNYSKGVITCQDLLNCTIEEIREELSPQGVIDARRISIKQNGELIPTSSIILTFNSPSIPEKIKAGIHVINVRLYIPNPVRCYNCQKYGHTAHNCREQQICICGQPPHSGSSCSTPLICVNCGDNHSARSRSCPAFQREMEIQRIKTINKLSYPDARRIVSTKNRNLVSSYAKVVSTNIKTNNIQTSIQSPDVNAIIAALIPELSKVINVQIQRHLKQLELNGPLPKNLQTHLHDTEFSAAQTDDSNHLTSEPGNTNDNPPKPYTNPTSSDTNSNKPGKTSKHKVSLTSLGIKPISPKKSGNKPSLTEYEETDMETETLSKKRITPKDNKATTSKTIHDELSTQPFNTSRELPSCDSSDSSIISAPSKQKIGRKRKS
ncbi:hypothetical protein KM043_018851 [Ampulex compressa]|nr:hypothetical protein KM043_018851 [Ampulex compressa]